MSKKIPLDQINKQQKQNIKITFISLISIIICLNTTNSQINKNRRILQKREFNPNSIYYIREFDMNNITGTGDKLKDRAYRAYCFMKNCSAGCCIGDINSMTCGDEFNCKVYNDYVYYLYITHATLIPISILIFLCVFILIFTKRNNYSLCKSLLLAIICLGIITIPFVLYYARYPEDKSKKKKKKVEKK